MAKGPCCKGLYPLLPTTPAILPSTQRHYDWAGVWEEWSGINFFSVYTFFYCWLVVGIVHCICNSGSFDPRRSFVLLIPTFCWFASFYTHCELLVVMFVCFMSSTPWFDAYWGVHIAVVKWRKEFWYVEFM